MIVATLLPTEIRYAIRDEFSRAASGPLPGSEHISGNAVVNVQTDGSLARAGGALVLTPQATPVWGDLARRYEVTTRARRRAIMARINLTSGTLQIGYWKGTTFSAANRVSVVEVSRTGDFLAGRPGSPGFDWGVPQLDVAIVPRASAGSCYFARSQAYGLPWSLFAVDWNNSDATLYPGLASYDADGSIERLRSRAEPTAPTQLISESTPSYGHTYTGAIAPLVDLKVTAGGSLTNGDELRLLTGYADADNHLRTSLVVVSGAVRKKIVDVTDGSATEISNTAVSLSAGGSLYVQFVNVLAIAPNVCTRATQTGASGAYATGALPSGPHVASGVRLERVGTTFTAAELACWSAVASMDRSY